MNTLRQDLRNGLRQLATQPLYSCIVIATLALGIGANAAIFTVINAALFRPLPYTDESRLVVLREYRTDDAQASQGVSYLNFVDWRSQSRSFESMAIATMDTATVRGDGEPLRVDGAVVSAGFFTTLGIQPLLGRTFTAADEQPGTSEGVNAVVLTHSSWQKHFGGDRRALGRTLTIDERPFLVVGVTPPGIFPLLKEPVDYFATTAVNGDPSDRESANGSRNFRSYPGVIARLKQGVSLRQAEAELATVQRGLEQQYPTAMAKRAVRVDGLRDLFVRDARGALWLLMGVVGAVLLIACVNVANVLLARSAARQREIGIRVALGASRWDILRQFLAESLMLSLAGGALGVLLSMWLVDGLTALLPADVPRLAGLQPDWRVGLFAFGAALLTGLACGLFPAITSTRSVLSDAIKEGGRQTAGDRTRRRLRNALVVGEVAIALTLLVAAGLLVNSLVRLTRVQPGFATDNTLTLQLALSGTRYGGPMDKPEALNSFLASLTEGVSSLPGVTAVAHAQCVPLTGNENNTGFEIIGLRGATGDRTSAQLRFISPGYFEALSIPLMEGRDFSGRDNPQAPPVMLVNQAFVREHIKDGQPLGRKLKLGWGGDGPKEIVGVVGNVRHRSLSDTVRAEMYVPQAQWANAGITLIVRSPVDPSGLINPIQRQIRALDPEVPITDIRSLAAWRAEALALPRFNAFLLGVFALLALVLTVVGLYGVVSYSVAQRTQEIGIRMALGAQPGDVVRLVIGQGMALVGVGAALGVLGALALTRLIQNQLFGVSATDPLTFLLLTALLAAVALAACWFPARRATKVDPLVALRCE